MLPGAMQPQAKQVQTPFTFLNSHQNKLPDEFLSPRPHGGVIFKGGTVASLALEAALSIKLDPTALATFTTHKGISANTRQIFSAERKSVAFSRL
jgi:hypothetical protein